MEQDEEETAVRVCDYLDRHHADIVTEWERQVRAALPTAEPLPRPVLLDHIPQLLTELAHWLRSDMEPRAPEASAASAAFGDLAEFHGAVRLAAGFDLRQVVTEYRLLRGCILSRLEHELTLPVLRDVTRLNQAIDVAVAEAVARYNDERARQLAETREAQFRLFVDSVSEYAIFALDPKGIITTWNVGAQRISGYRADEIVGQHFSRFYPEEEVRAGKCELELEQAARVGRFEEQGWRLRKDGSRYVANVLITAIRDPKDGALVGFSKITRDLTERRNAEDERTGLTTLINSIPPLAWSARADGWIDYYNDRWYRYTGTTAEQMEGWGWQSVHDPAELPRVMERWRQSLATGEPFEMRFPLRRADGEFRWHLTRVAPLRDASGSIVRWFGTNTDIDDQVRTEQRLAEALERETVARAESERAARLNELFVAILGHDLRNPMGAIVMGANLLLRSVGSEKDLNVTRRIAASAERMARMINQLLDFTRIRIGGGLALNRERVDLRALCRRVIEELETAHPECKLSLDVQGEETSGEWDSDRILQALSNLVGNAVEHGTINRPVRLRVEGHRNSVSVMVQNEGAVPPALLPVLFDPFRGSRSSERKGLGIGLFITQQIVVAHGGTVDVSSSETEGTTFRVDLPRSAPR